MNPELQQRISAIKAECEEILRQDKEIMAAPWHADINYANDFVMSGKRYVCGLATMVGREPEFRFIAHSRNVSPAMARVVLMCIQWCVSQDDTFCLEHIANHWEGK